MLEGTGTDRRGMADDGDQVTPAARLHREDAEPAVRVVEGDPLDEAGQVLLCGWRRRHACGDRSTSPVVHG